MNAIRMLGFLLVFSLACGAQGATEILGNWRTIDDTTGKTKSIVRIYETASGLIEGQIIEILHSDRGPNPLCDDCPGERKDQPINGMVIIWGLEAKSGTEAKGGHILDPKNGKVYKAKLKLRDDGKLEVRGYIGFSLIGRTQVWEPVQRPQGSDQNP